MERPDLSQLSAEIRAYIEALETQLLSYAAPKAAKMESSGETTEPPTTLQLIVATAQGQAKRTPRHLYTRQRRGGMGVFDIEVGNGDHPALLCSADLHADLLMVTDQGRLFRLAVQAVPETPLRGHGSSLHELAGIDGEEKIVALLSADAGQYLNLISQRGWVRRIRQNYLNKSMIQGIRYHKVSEGGYITGACWTDGQSDLLIATRNGLGLRFSESQIPSNGGLGVRIEPTDVAMAICSADDQAGIFLIGHDGLGTIRQMGGFRKNAAPGAGAKLLFKSERLVGVCRYQEGSDLVLISQLSKVIRFSADEVPAKEGVVQGVNCMNLRSDFVTACAVLPPL